MQGHIKLTQSDIKDKYSVTKYFSFKFQVDQNNPEKRFPQYYKAAQLFSALLLTRNVLWAENQHIRMISEGSCDRSNDAEIQIHICITKINYTLKCIKIEI